MIIDRLQQAVIRCQNPTVLGLDTQWQHVPRQLWPDGPKDDPATAARAILDYNLALLDALSGLVPAVKVQSAYYEQLGVPGVSAFAATIKAARERGYLVIADAKRNDIGPTAQAYANAFLGETALPEGKTGAFDADFLTVNAYLGIDGVQPFLDACKAYDRGVFVLVKTSNPSSGQLQDLAFQDGRTLYETMGDLVAQWGGGLRGECGYSGVGAVVGATHPAQGAALRKRLGNVFFLIPGYGAQGAKAEDLAGMFGPHGRGAVVNASRSLLLAHQKKDSLPPLHAVVAEAKEMQRALLDAVGGEIS